MWLEVDMGKIPQYLHAKLALLDIKSVAQMQQIGVVKVFQWLRAHYPSLSYNTLYDLYCICNNLALNSINTTIKKDLILEYKLLSPCYMPLSVDLMHEYMHLAVVAANIALEHDEVPIGAVIVYQDKVIAIGYNKTCGNNDILQHAEINAIQQAQSIVGNYRLHECDLYVTIEPCLMCRGAIINSQIKRVIFGAYELKTGAVNSQYNVFSNTSVNHHTQAIGPLDNDLYSRQVKEFFSEKRLNGGSCEIRTHEGLASSPVFKTGAFNRSAKLPSS